ncbi:MAG: hypothetical protein EB103_02845, partial [Actinobacteria bacterium]|nr:hypothetical protein [Actinomycetota bacterium]
MSSLISRTRGLVSILAAAVLVLAPMQVSASNAVGTDTSLQTFTVNGQAVEDGSSVTLPIGTTSVAVVAEATDIDATVDVTGGTGLVAGDNPLTVTVTNDEVNVQVYNVNLFVQSLSSDTSLKSWKVNGVEVVEDEDIFLPYLTDSVTVVAEANDANASVLVQGASDLVSGVNILSVVVTAEDGTTQTYNANLAVAFNSDVSLITFQVNGEDVVDGSTVEVEPLTSEVDVVVETADIDATYVISGDTDLQDGENTLSVIVTAADGETVGEYYVTLNVALNTDASVIGIFVNGIEVVDGETIDIEAGTGAVDVDVETTDPVATVEISGNEDLIVGENVLTILVTAADSTTTAEYLVYLNLLSNDDVSLATFQVNNIDVEDGTSLDIDPLTESVDVFVETTDVNATFAVSGDTELVVGANELLVTVTAADGVTEFTYTVVLNVLPNVDASAEILVNGELVADGAELTLEWGNTDVEVEVNTNDPDATVAITGDSGLVVGENQLAVVVT